jgi:hypothetical protein
MDIIPHLHVSVSRVEKLLADICGCCFFQSIYSLGDKAALAGAIDGGLACITILWS